MKFKLESARYDAVTKVYAKALSDAGFVVTVTKEDDCVEYEIEIEVDSIESLMKIMQVTKNRIVLNNSTITIYDYYIE